MGYNHLLLPAFLLISYLFLIPNAFSSHDSYLAFNCTGTGAMSTDYQQSLAYLVDDLCANAPDDRHNGFRNASWAQDPADRAYGLALCRGDVPMDHCKTCLINATMEVANTDCPDSRGAIIWHDHCMLKYSDKPFFGQIDNDYRFKSYDGYYASLAWNGTFKNTTQGLLNGLVDEAAKNATVSMFAHGNKTYGNEAVYAMVQCTRDLSIGNCTTCLNGTIKDLSSPWISKRGAKAFSGSCMMRYEIYPFLN